MSQGVCSHSTISAQEEWVIFAVKDERMAFNFRAFADANGIKYKSLLGRYNGELERSFLVAVGQVEVICEHGFLDGQEKVLYLSTSDARGRRPAHLITISTLAEEYIGHLVETTLGPLAWQDYSYDESSNTYWVCVKPHNAAAVPLTPFSRAEVEAYLAYRQRVEAK